MKITPTSVRLPSELKLEVLKFKKANRRESLSNAICYLIEQGLSVVNGSTSESIKQAS